MGGISQKSMQVMYWLRLCVFIDLFGVALVVPLLTTYFRAAGVSTEMVGYISSLYYASQLLGGVVIGALSDVLPRRDVLMISFIGSAISYFIVGHTSQIWLLFATRAMVGLVKQTMTISTSIITEIGDLQNRANDIAMLDAASTLAFIIGPIAGSILYKINPKYPAICASSLFIFDIGLCYLTIPRNVQTVSQSINNSNNSEKLSSDIVNSKPSFMSKSKSLYDNILQVLKNKSLLFHLVALFSINFTERAMQHSNMISFFEIRYSLQPHTLGYIASASSIIALIAQTYFVQKAKLYWGSEQQAIVYCLFFTAISYVAEYFSMDIYQYFIFVAPIMLSSARIISACSKSALSSSVPVEHVGKMFGVLNVLDAVSGVAAPIYGSEIFSRSGYRNRSIVALIHYVILACWVRFVFLKDKQNSMIQNSINFHKAELLSPASVAKTTPEHKSN